MEVVRTDAEIARDRALAAMMASEDDLVRVSLWRLAVKFNLKARHDAWLAGLAFDDFEASEAGEIASPAPRNPAWGGSIAGREW